MRPLMGLVSMEGIEDETFGWADAFDTETSVEFNDSRVLFVCSEL